MKIKIDSTLERDIDLLIIEEFVSDKDFAKIFLNAVQITEEYEILQAIHSKVDAELGESDIVFILEINGKRHALHIEDKIDAIAMEDQSGRYIKRAEKDIANGEYDTYSFLIVAPQKYLEADKEAQKYPYQVSYEQLQAYFHSKTDIRSKYKLSLIERAIIDQKNGYQWEANPHVVRFCTDMYDYQKQAFPGMQSGTVAWWPIYKTYLKNIEVWFKANKGFCDLCFTKTSANKLYLMVKDVLRPGMTVEATGKSSAVRIVVKPINFEDNFEDVKEDVHQALTAINKLLEFAYNLDLNA